MTVIDPTLLGDLESLVDDDCRGDRESLLGWTAKSVRQLAACGIWVTESNM